MIVDWKGLQSRALGLALLANTFTTTITLAQSNSGVTFFYPINGTEIQNKYADNRASINLLDTIVLNAIDQPFRKISQIYITGYASVDGGYAFNERVAKERAEAAQRFMQKRYPLLGTVPYNLKWVAEDWTTLSEWVAGQKTPEMKRVMAIIQKQQNLDRREREIRQLGKGAAYNKIKQALFYKQRRVEVDLETESKANDSILQRANHIIYTLGETLKNNVNQNRWAEAKGENIWLYESDYTIHPVKKPRERRWAIKTNLAQWAGFVGSTTRTTVVANLAAEYFWRQHLAIEAGIMYGYSHYSNRQHFQGISGYRLEARKYFDLPRRLTLTAPTRYMRIFAGPYVRMGDYDRRYNHNALSRTGNYWDAGLSAGLAMQLPVGIPLWIEAGWRAGYLHEEIITYKKEAKQNWFLRNANNGSVKITDINISINYKL